MMQDKLQEYARLLVEVGIHLRKNQKLVIECQADHASFARMCADIAYENGCAEVVMNWGDEYIERAGYLHADGSVFDFYPAYKQEFVMEYCRCGAGFLHLASRDPHNLLGVDNDRIMRARKARAIGLSDYKAWLDTGKNPWCIGALASPAWAKTVFPHMNELDAINALWESIFAANRVKGDGSAVAAWREHVAKMAVRTEKLNSYRFTSLHYFNSLGTDLTVGLCENHVWESGGDTTVDGQFYIPNMPTEEIFTAPDRGSANGVVYASVPLCMDGNAIEGIRLALKDGRIISASAKNGEQILKNALAVDDGASRLGEVALVPYDSPIRRTGTLFFNTLFDENASCHFAFGSAYPTSVKGGIQMTREQREAAGLNQSSTHADFMIGTDDLSVDGVTHEGETVAVFRNGNFVF